MPHLYVHGSLWKWIVSAGAILLLLPAILWFSPVVNIGLDLGAAVTLLVVALTLALAGLIAVAYGLRLRGPGEGGFLVWSDMSGQRKGVTLSVLGVLPLLAGGYMLWLACYPQGLIVSCPAGGCTGSYPRCDPSASLVGIALGALGADMIGLGLILVWWNRARSVRTKSYRIKVARTR